MAIEKNDRRDEMKSSVPEGAGYSSVAKRQLPADVVYSILAHDLKGPVGNMLILLDLMLNEKDEMDDESLEEMLTGLRQSAESMNDLLENFIFWIRMGNFDFTVKPKMLSLASVVSSNIRSLSGLARKKNIRIEVDIPDGLSVSADEYLINTVLRNIIHNSLKFTGKNGVVVISATDKGGFVSVSIKDNGIGMNDEEVSKLFDPNEHFTTRGTEMESGSGLGLYFCKEFIEKNGGRISVDSQKGIGTDLRFTIPVSDS